MAKPQKSFVCQSCGAVTPRWAGRCESCLEWNTISEETAAASIPKGMSANKKGRVIDFVDLRAGANASYPRYITKIGEFDRVTGGGLVPGSATLIGGDPGIGKSTLLLQVVCALSRNGIPSVYVSGEEAVEQIRMRAERLGLADSPVQLAAATNVRDIIDSVKAAQTPPKILIIDSIQTMYIDNIDSAPGTAPTSHALRTASSMRAKTSVQTPKTSLA